MGREDAFQWESSQRPPQIVRGFPFVVGLLLFKGLDWKGLSLSIGLRQLPSPMLGGLLFWLGGPLS